MTTKLGRFCRRRRTGFSGMVTLPMFFFGTSPAFQLPNNFFSQAVVVAKDVAARERLRSVGRDPERLLVRAAD